MTQQPEYIQLDANDDVASVRDRLSFIRGRRVLLIWPEEGTALTRKLDLILVQREAKRRVIQLAFVTHDETVMTHATELGISTFETVNRAERSKWKRGRSRVFMPRYHKPEHEPDPDDLMPVASRVRNKRKGLSRLWYLATRALVLLAIIGTIGAVAYVALPTATITLTLEQELVTIETTIRAETNANDVDVDNGIIPATTLRANVQTVGTVETTGRQNSTNAAATGTVTISNNTARSVTIPAGTVVSTSTTDAVQFRTLREAIVPPNRSVDVRIEATDEFTGTIGNVGAGRINEIEDTYEERVSVQNLTPTTGGSNNQFSVVTLDDQERLMGIVRGQLQAAALTEMQSRLSETQLIVLETLHIAEDRPDWTTFTPQVGETSDTVSLNMRAVVEALAIDDRFAQQVVFARLSAQKPPNLILQTDSLYYSRGGVEEILDTDSVIFNASGDGYATAQLDRPRLQQQLAGQSLADARDLLTQSVTLAPDTEPTIDVQPAWLNRMPFLPVRIEIRTQS